MLPWKFDSCSCCSRVTGLRRGGGDSDNPYPMAVRDPRSILFDRPLRRGDSEHRALPSQRKRGPTRGLGRAAGCEFAAWFLWSLCALCGPLWLRICGICMVIPFLLLHAGTTTWSGLAVSIAGHFAVRRGQLQFHSVAVHQPEPCWSDRVVPARHRRSASTPTKCPALNCRRRGRGHRTNGSPLGPTERGALARGGRASSPNRQ